PQLGCYIGKEFLSFDMAVLAVLAVGRQFGGFSSTTRQFVMMRGRKADELLKGGGIKRFIFEEFPGDKLQLITMAGENLFRFVIGVSENLFHLGVDELSRLFAAIALEGPVGAGQQDSILFLSAAGEADRIAHAEETNHLARQGGCMFE